MNKQVKLIKFLVRYPDKWHTFASDKQTVSIVCASVNLGIVEINEYRQMRLKSKIKAGDFLNAKGN